MDRKQIIQTVLNSPSVQAQIESRATKEKVSSAQISKKAASYCEEIFSSPNQGVVKVMQKLLSFFWNKFYSGTAVHGIDRVTKIADTHQIVYVPCHRSHVDYLLLSYTIDQYGLEIPLIAAGNNLNMPIIGKILRGGGAFFIRRSFKGNALYTAVMQEYINQIIQHAKTMEYFIEGGRSRTGLLLKPKLGMLSMTLKAYLSHRKKPLAFVPIYIGYEKVIEGATYQKELSGKNKKKETFIGSLFSIVKLSGHFGQVRVGVDEPIMMDDILNQHHSEWQQQSEEISGKPDWFQKSLKQLALQIMQGINRASVPNSANWLMTILMNTQTKSLKLSVLLEQTARYQELIKQTNEIIKINKIDSAEIQRIAQQGLIDIESGQADPDVFITADKQELANYYVNNTRHLFVLPALLANIALQIVEASVSEFKQQLDKSLETLASHFFLSEYTQDNVDKIINFYCQKQLLNCTDQQLMQITTDEEKLNQLKEWANLSNIE